MLNFQWPVWENESDNTKFNTPAPHSHLRPCNTNESHETGETKWLIGPNLEIVLAFVANSLDSDQSVIFSVLSHEKIYTYIQNTHTHIYKNVRGVLTSVRYCIYTHT